MILQHDWLIVKILSFDWSIGNLPSWFDNWDPRLPEIKHIIKAGMYIPLPGDEYSLLIG